MTEWNMQGPRARRLLRRSMPSTMGRFPSLKSDRTIHWESQLERDLVLLLEFDPSVLEYREQPLTIQVDLADRVARYTPDFLVRKAHGFHVIEVKPSKFASEPAWQDLFARAAAYFAAEGAQYEVLTEHEIRRQPRLSNASLLFRYQRIPLGENSREIVRQTLAGGALPLSNVDAALRAQGSAPGAVYALLARGVLATDLDRSLGPDSPIQLA